MIAAILFVIAQQAQVSNLVFEVKDLQFEVVSFGAATQDLAVKESDTETVIDMSADVLFDFDKADLRPAAEQTLSKAAALIQEKAKKGAGVRIEGHTDAKGNDAYNQKLSERRAEAVKSWFVSHGVTGVAFTTQGFGAKHPVAPNTKPDGSDDPEGRQKNRRVEIVIRK
jgi:outer membrane protein OmpA-like peptidoglycan-associated protein